MKLSTWSEAKIIAKALAHFLSKHCQSCDMRHTAMCMDGGRCVGCGATLYPVENLSESTKQAAERLGV